MGRPRAERNGEVSESNLVALPKILHRESSTLLRFAWDDLKEGLRIRVRVPPRPLYK